MRKYLMALAATALLASQAGAATITGPTTVVAGQSYTYTYTPNAPADLLPNYTYFTMHLKVNGGDEVPGGKGFNSDGSDYLDGMTFSFDWIFTTPGPAVLSVQSVLVTYLSTLVYVDGEVINKPDFRVFNSGFAFDGEEPETLRISVVPIGGTLPLLLSALGAFGWAARRRKAQAALPA